MNGEKDMALPEGKTCVDCKFFRKCWQWFQCKPTNVECDFSPSKFTPKQPETKT